MLQACIRIPRFFKNPEIRYGSTYTTLPQENPKIPQIEPYLFNAGLSGKVQWLSIRLFFRIFLGVFTNVFQHGFLFFTKNLFFQKNQGVERGLKKKIRYGVTLRVKLCIPTGIHYYVQPLKIPYRHYIELLHIFSFFMSKFQ